MRHPPTPCCPASTMSATNVPVLQHMHTHVSSESGKIYLDGEKKGVISSDVDIADVEADLEAIEADIIAAQADSENLTYEEARVIVQEILDEYQLGTWAALRHIGLSLRNVGPDPNFPPQIMENAVKFLNDTSIKQDPVHFRRVFREIKVAASFLRDNSPYPEVRAVYVHDMALSTSPIPLIDKSATGLIIRTIRASLAAHCAHGSLV